MAKRLKDMISIEDGLLHVKEGKRKNEQIIVRLPLETKDKLQKVADDLNIDMSKLIRNKIDEIIEEHELFKDNKKIVDEKDNFMKTQELIGNKIIDKELVEELREQFKKKFMEKVQKEIDETPVLGTLLEGYEQKNDNL